MSAAIDSQAEIERLRQRVAELERELRENRQDIHAVVDGIPGMVGMLEADGKLLLLNRGLLEFTGKTLDELQRWGSNDTMHVDDLARVRETFGHAMATGTPYYFELRLRRHDGVFRWFCTSGTPSRDEAGNIQRWYTVASDIHERVMAEEATRASERNLSIAINALPALVWSANADDGSAEFFSQHYLDYTGKAMEQMSGWQWITVIHPDDRRVLGETWEAIRSSGMQGEIEVEARIQSKDGQYRWFLFRANPLRDEAGRITKWFGVNTDIDERRRARTLLAAEKGLLELVAKGRPLGETLKAIRAAVEGAYLGCDCEVQLAGGRSGADPRSVEPALRIPVVSKKGDLLANLCLYPRGSADLADHEDITALAAHIASIAIERDRAEDELRRREYILAAAERLTQTGSFAYEAGVLRLTYSDELRRIFEFEADEAMTVVMQRGRIHPDDAQLVQEIYARADSGQGNPRYEIRLLMPDGRVKYVTGMSHVVRYEDGSTESLGAVQDITERKLAEFALDKVRSDLAHVTRVMSLGTLTASIAHEVNQPLTGIVTNASTCVRMLSSEPPNVSGALETARRTIRDANRASEVVARLRALFAKNTTSSTTVGLNDAAAEVVSLMSNDLHRNRVQVQTEFAADLPTIAADRVQLQQVILNLIRNASDAMSELDRPRVITLRTANDGDSVRLSVQDAGVGFADGAAERMFQPFYTTKESGMGIGLSVSRSIVESHAGRLWAEPVKNGDGALFSFTIPIKRP